MKRPEDLSFPPSEDPSSLKGHPTASADTSITPENVHFHIVNDQDVTLLHWRRATATPPGGGSPPGVAGTQDKPLASEHGNSPRLHVATTEGVTVVSFVEARTVSAENMQEVGDQLYTRANALDPRQLLLNLRDVPFLSAAALGKLITLKKTVAAFDGKLKLCCLHPDLLEVFRMSRLDEVFEVYADEQSARARF